MVCHNKLHKKKDEDNDNEDDNGDDPGHVVKLTKLFVTNLYRLFAEINC